MFWERLADSARTSQIKHILHNKKEVCIFVGAGASIMHPCGLPSFRELNDALLAHLYQDVAADQSLPAALKGIHTKPEQLLQIIWDYTDGSFNPVECFQNVVPNRNHHLIAELVEQGAACIVTPNFDPCLEKALEKKKLPFQLFHQTPDTEAEAGRLLNAIKGGKPVIWKPHGDCRKPESLCYTRTKVARLSNSRHLRDIFSYIIQHYHMLFLGYSGYDDDFFPILYEIYPGSGRQIVWNSYKKPMENEPCHSLWKRSQGNFHFWTGDMGELLEELTGGCACHADEKSAFQWRAYLEQQFETVVKSKKAAMLGKYLNDFGLVEEARKVWRTGLGFSKHDIMPEDRLRFQMNLGMLGQEKAYEKAMEGKYYYIAEIALGNLIMASLGADNDQETSRLLREYLKNCRRVPKNYFKMGRYYQLVYEAKIKLSGKTALQLQKDFETAYQALTQEGEIMDAIGLMANHYSAVTAQNQGKPELLEESALKIDQLVPYGNNYVIANAYYYMANLAITTNQYDMARRYHEKCVHVMELCCANGSYQGEQEMELWSYIYHQEALIESDKQVALQKEQMALQAAEKLQDEKQKAYHKGFIYNSFCSLYMRDNYDMAVKYGRMALKCGKQSGSLQNMARTLTYLAVADAKHGMRQEAIRKFRESYAIHLQIQEGLDFLYAVLDECKIELSEIQ